MAREPQRLSPNSLNAVSRRTVQGTYFVVCHLPHMAVFFSLFLRVGLAARGGVGLVHAILRVGALHHRVEPQIGVALERRGAVRDRGQAANGVIHAASIVVTDHAAVRVGDAHRAAVVRSTRCRHEAVTVLDAGRAGYDGSRMRLSFAGELTQAVVAGLDLVGDGRAGVSA